jgi:hypothetical protein
MIELFLGLRQAVEDGAQDEENIAGSRPLFRDFFEFWDHVMGMGSSVHGFTHA